LSTALIRCPNCGSVSSQTSVPDEYICSHCHARFKFVRPGDQTITHDIQAHYCPVCDEPIEAGKGYRCRRCQKVDLCPKCIRKTPEGNVCISCLNRDGDDCQYSDYTMDDRCRNYAEYKCVICNKPGDNPPDRYRPSTKTTAVYGVPSRLCKEHEWVWGLHLRDVGARSHGPNDALYCETCGGWVCSSCAIWVSYRNWICANCRSQLKLVTMD
jgi:hypothetical protein